MRRIKKQRLQIICAALAVLLTLFPVQGIKAQSGLPGGRNSEGNGQACRMETGWLGNPVYEDIYEAFGEPERFTQSITYETEGIRFYSAGREFYSREAAAAWLNERLIQRESSISFVYHVSAEDIRQELNMVWDAAMNWNGGADPRSGDYLFFHFGRQNMSARCSSDGRGNYRCEVTYTVQYHSDLQEEQRVSAKVTEVLRQLQPEKKSDYQKVKAIYDYICDNVVYDYDNLNNEAYVRKYSAYAALIDKKAVCQGYALLFYRMCMEAGIPVKIVAGYGNGENHAWNIVKLGGRYYNADATWDAPRKAAGLGYEYFLKSDADFSDHTRRDSYGTSDFYGRYPMADRSYEDRQETPDSGEEKPDPELPVVSGPDRVNLPSVSSQGTPGSLKVVWDAVPEADGYEVYSRAAGESAYRLAGTAEGGGNTEYLAAGLLTGRNYYYQVRAYRNDGRGGKVFGDFSAAKGAHVAVAPALFQVKGCFGGREVTFGSASAGTGIYYSFTGSNLTLQDACVENGGTVTFGGFYGSIYARAYDVRTGAWSPVSRLILRIPTVNTPLIRMDGRYAEIRCTTPSSCFIYTLDGTQPSPENGKRLWGTGARIPVGRGQTLKVMSVRSCFGSSGITEVKY